MTLPDDPDTLVRLLYLGVLLAGLLALSFNGGPLRIGRWLRDLAIWGLVAAMIIIVYANRDTLRASLFPGRAVVGADGAIELRRGLDGHFSADLVVNGAPIRFLVDTGATDIVLGRSDARRAGLDPASLAFTGRAVTANGTVATAPVRLDRLEFGSIRLNDVPASVTDGGFDGSLLGMRFLSRFGRIEIEGDRMRLTH